MYDFPLSVINFDFTPPLQSLCQYWCLSLGPEEVELAGFWPDGAGPTFPGCGKNSTETGLSKTISGMSVVSADAGAGLMSLISKTLKPKN